MVSGWKGGWFAFVWSNGVIMLGGELSVESHFGGCRWFLGSVLWYRGEAVIGIGHVNGWGVNDLWGFAGGVGEGCGGGWQFGSIGVGHFRVFGCVSVVEVIGSSCVACFVVVIVFLIISFVVFVLPIGAIVSQPVASVVVVGFICVVCGHFFGFFFVVFGW